MNQKTQLFQWTRWQIGLSISLFFALLLLGGFTFLYARGGSYLSNDPKACVNCHVMRDMYDSWQKGSHHALATCNDCHLPHDFVGKYIAKMENGYNHGTRFTMQDFHEPIMIHQKNKKIVQANCVSCHQTLIAESVGAKRGTHVDHDRSTDCTRCHQQTGHGASD